MIGRDKFVRMPRDGRHVQRRHLAEADRAAVDDRFRGGGEVPLHRVRDCRGIRVPVEGRIQRAAAAEKGESAPMPCNAPAKAEAS